MTKFLLLLPFVALFFPGCALFLNKAFPQVRGEIAGLPVTAKVEIIRDSWGIPHIRAGNTHDLFVAQGYVHAQDRMWQMEFLRRLTDGRLAEIAGKKMVAVDYACRVVGMPDIKRRALADLSPEELAFVQAYADGVNAYLTQRGKDLPLEFRSMGTGPEPWTPVDSMSFLALLSFQMLYAQYAEELFAVARGSAFTSAEWNDLFPSFPGANLPPESFFDTLAPRKLGALNPAYLVFHGALPDRLSQDMIERSLLSLAGPNAGSNNWAVSVSSDGKPLLANDPHLGLTLPATWYFCHLEGGGINAAGTSVAGTPGIVLGRNEHVAWSATNVELDAIDTLFFTVDPSEPTRYRIRGREKEMLREDVVIGLPKGDSVSLPVYRTEAGPVVTEVKKGVQAVAVLKWYGTLPEGALHDHSFRAIFSYMTAETAAQVLEAGRNWVFASQNLLAADDKGHIGWHATGAAPVRTGYTGRLPGDGSAGADWTGFLSYDSLPHAVDPTEGWLATANQRPTGWNGPALSYTWAAPYRYEWIASVVGSMRAPGIEDFRRLQMDVHSVQADRILPKVLSFAFTDGRARKAVDILKAWNREVDPGSAGAALYEVFLVELVRALLGDVLGDDIALYFNAKLFGIEDVILDRPGSPFWRGEPAKVVEEALVKAMESCRARMGADPRRWSWQRLHRFLFAHPGATNAIFRKLLNRGPYAAPGDNTTVNPAYFMPPRDSYDVTWIPSMRMIVPLGDPDGMRIIGPLGQSGQPGHPHYDDMTPSWVKGDPVRLPLSRAGVEAVAKDRLTLSP